MAKQSPLSGAGKVLPKEALERLALFAEWTGVKAPAVILDEDGGPTNALLAYCKHNGLSLDWLFHGDVRGMVMRLHRLTCGHILNTRSAAPSAVLES